MVKLGEKISELSGKIESQQEPFTAASTILEQLAKIKLSGYIQGRFEYHEDSLDGLSTAGKPTDTTQFLVRRGRLKTIYAPGTLSEFVLQIDATPKGVVLKDAEATFIEPWSGLDIRFTAGQLKWPFGYEVLQSSGIREMPERSRVVRSLFPGERDKGVRLQINPSFLRFSAAVVNGNGTEDAIYTANDQNKDKDLVARLGIDADWIAFGVSGYYGEGLATTLADTKANPPTSNTWTEFKKTRIGADLQLYTDIPLIGGVALKGEFIRGSDFKTDPFGFWVLTILNWTDSFATFARFDRYDPDLGKQNNRIDTIGGGFHYFFSSNAKLSTIYEHPISQISQNKTDPTDDSLTVQLQGMF